MSAEFATEETMAFFVRHSSGMCVAMEGNRLDELNLLPMVADSSNGESMGTAFTVTVDAKRGTMTGISAVDRDHGTDTRGSGQDRQPLRTALPPISLACPLDSPTVSFAPTRASTAQPRIRRVGRIAASVLTERQGRVGRAFAASALTSSPG
jgi:hypothetical protein